jgi:predicted permease
MSIIARVSPGVSVERARSMFTAWMIAETQGSAERERARGATFTPRGTSMPHDPEVIAMFAPVIIAFLLVMLIACANVANLMLARGMARQREIGIRLTLGAGRSRLIRQLLAEALMLALPAGLLGFVISRVTIAASLSALFATVPTAYATYIRVIPLDADLRIVGFMLCAAVMAAVAFGLVPALQATRPDVVRASRGDFETAMRPSRLRNALVVAQVTMSVLLLVLAGVLLASARRTERLDPGIRTADVVQVEMLPRFRARGLDVLKDELVVKRLASSSGTALDGAFSQANAAAAGKPSQRAFFNIVSPGWFDVLDLPIERGRQFTEDEGRERAPVAVVSRSAAAALWPGRDPIGETLTIPDGPRFDGRLRSYRTARVVGVTTDVSPGSIAIDPRTPVVYYPQPLDAGVTQFLARVSGDPEQARQAVERAMVTKVDSTAAVETHTLATSLALQVYPFRAVYWIAAAIGAIALVLTLIGVYGVMSYLVAQRRKEFGIRLALGAPGDALIALVLRQSMRMASMGVVIGVALALGVSKLFDVILYNVDMFNPAGYLAGVAVVAGTCLAAAYVPSRRAAAVDPVEALRAD